MKMKLKFFVLLIIYPCLSPGQTNHLYRLLNWNSSEQQKRLIAWYDLQDKTTIRLSTNTPNGVYSIDDKSVWKNNIKQPESSFQPLLKVDNGFINGEKNGLSFANGGFMTYYFSSEKYVSAITSFVVCRNDIGGSKLLFDLSYDGGEGVASCYSGLYKIESRVPNSLAQFEPDFSNNPSKILLLSTKGSSGKIKSYLNEVSYLGPGSRNFQGTSYNRIRLSTPSGVAPTDGTLYELILFDYELDDAEFNIVKKYLEDKYQLNYELINSSLSINEDGTKNISTTTQASVQNSNAENSKSSLLEGSSQNTQQKSLSDLIADKMIQEGYNDFLKGLNNPSPTTPRTPTNQSSRFNSWQCNFCGFLSRGNKKPDSYQFGKCQNSNIGHGWREANWNHGFQCRECGLKSYIIDDKGHPKNPGSNIWYTSTCTSSIGHRWDSF